MYASKSCTSFFLVQVSCTQLSRALFQDNRRARNTNHVKGKANDLYHGSMQFEDHRRTALQYPFVHWTLCRCQQYGAFSMKALARYQVILLGEQRHIRCEPLAQGCCPNNGIMPWSESNPRTLDHESNAPPLHHRVTCA